VAALTHVGKRRYTNEDCIAVDAQIFCETMNDPSLFKLRLDTHRVCLVADGMGGHPAGDVASRIAVETLCAEALHPDMDDQAIIAAVRRANRALFEAMERAPEVIGMGTTIAGLTACERSITIFNVGDSRIYRIREGAVEQISTDDSEDIVTSFLAMDFPTRALNQCLGGYPGVDEVTPHLVREPAQANCAYLICSDGLSDMLNDTTIAACLGADLDQSVRTLFECAMAEGGIDNISIILARLEEDAAAARGPSPV
jgi:serine/threonine protein phosphatase PrpC